MRPRWATVLVVALLGASGASAILGEDPPRVEPPDSEAVPDEDAAVPGPPLLVGRRTSGAEETRVPPGTGKAEAGCDEPLASIEWTLAVTTDMGAPLAGVRVWAEFLRRGADCYDRECGRGSGETDDRGEVRLAVPEEARTAEVHVEPPEGWSHPTRRRIDAGGRELLLLRGPELEPRWVPADGVGVVGVASSDPGQRWSPAHLTLEPTRVLRVRLEARADGQGPRGFTWAAWSGGRLGWEWAMANPDAEGVYVVEVPRAADTLVLVATRERTQRSLVVGPAPAGVTEATCRVPEAEISGQVVDEDGSPIPWGSIDLRGAAGDAQLLAGEGAATGSFRVTDLVPGEYKLRCWSEDGERFGRARSTAPATGCRIVCRLAGAVEGTFEGGSGGPLAVDWTGDPEESRVLEHSWRAHDPVARRAFQDHLEDERDGFSIPWTPGEPGAIYARWPGRDDYAWVEDVAPCSGPVRLRLVPGASIEGTVCGFAEEECRVLRVRARAPAVLQQATVDARGGFRLTGLPPGGYTVELVSETVGGLVLLDEADGVLAGSRGVVLRRDLDDVQGRNVRR
jgi:hypothetical protein